MRLKAWKTSTTGDGAIEKPFNRHEPDYDVFGRSPHENPPHPGREEECIYISYGS